VTLALRNDFRNAEEGRQALANAAPNPYLYAVDYGSYHHHGNTYLYVFKYFFAHVSIWRKRFQNILASANQWVMIFADQQTLKEWSGGHGKDASG
jgi:hypothetical protein